MDAISYCVCVCPSHSCSLQWKQTRQCSYFPEYQSQHKWYFASCAAVLNGGWVSHLGPWRAPACAVAKPGPQWACAKWVCSLRARLVTDINSWRYSSAELRDEQSCEKEDAGGLQLLYTEIWVVEGGLTEQGAGRRIDLLHRAAIQFSGNISLDLRRTLPLSNWSSDYMRNYVCEVSVPSLLIGTLKSVCKYPSITA